VAEVRRAGAERPDWGQTQSDGDGNADPLARCPISPRSVTEDLPVTGRSQSEPEADPARPCQCGWTARPRSCCLYPCRVERSATYPFCATAGARAVAKQLFNRLSRRIPRPPGSHAGGSCAARGFTLRHDIQGTRIDGRPARGDEAAIAGGVRPCRIQHRHQRRRRGRADGGPPAHPSDPSLPR
jgi:hypothetical protein